MARELARKSRAPQGARPKNSSGGVTRFAAPRGLATTLATPVGASALGLGADVSGELETIAPTFGTILAAIGDGVANAQTALDKSVVDTVQALANTKITVVSEVVEVLDDDGLPDVEQTQLITQNVSVLNY